MKNCPFCGNSAADEYNGVHVKEVDVTPWGIDTGKKGYYVICGRCGARGGYAGEGSLAGLTREEAKARAIEKWNERI